VIKRHRFQFFIRLSPGLPTNFPDRFTSPGRYSFEAAFAPRARRYRSSNRLVIMLLVGFALGTMTTMILPVREPARLWMVAASMALLPVAVIIHFVNRWLRCPSCHKALAPAKGAYCPQCGSDAYRAGSRWCEDCRSRIEEETGDDSRSYRIRGCTHCGVFLDEQGL
jgi:hypothetical protein